MNPVNQTQATKWFILFFQHFSVFSLDELPVVSSVIFLFKVPQTKNMIHACRPGAVRGAETKTGMSRAPDLSAGARGYMWPLIRFIIGLLSFLIRTCSVDRPVSEPLVC